MKRMFDMSMDFTDADLVLEDSSELTWLDDLEERYDFDWDYIECEQ